VLNNICFGINDTIILFISYIRNNTNIVLSIAQKATELLVAYDELDFDKNNVPFLTEKFDDPVKLPTEKETHDAKVATEYVEEIRQDEQIIYKGIFDYNEADSTTEKYKIIRALKYVQFVGRSLLSQQSYLKTKEIDALINVLYTLPNKILYAILKPYQDKYNEVLSDVKMILEKVLPEESDKEELSKELIGRAAMILVLNVYNDIAFNCSDSNTIRVLNEYDLNNTNRIVENLWMLDNAGNSVNFVDRVIGLSHECHDNKLLMSLIGTVAKKHIIYNGDIGYKLVDQLVSAKVFTPASKKSLLLNQFVAKSKN